MAFTWYCTGFEEDEVEGGFPNNQRCSKKVCWSIKVHSKPKMQGVENNSQKGQKQEHDNKHMEVQTRTTAKTTQSKNTPNSPLLPTSATTDQSRHKINLRHFNLISEEKAQATTTSAEV